MIADTSFRDFLSWKSQFHLCNDVETGAQSVIAVHNASRYPALGGCRYMMGASLFDAVQAAASLARSMSYKALTHDLPLSGGKSVIVAPPSMHQRDVVFKNFGKFVDSLQGQYITAVDVGVDENDLNDVANETQYVTHFSEAGGGPSPLTAQGVCLAIERAVSLHLNRNSLEGVHIVVQGVGKVGYELVGRLLERGTKVSVCDVNSEKVKICEKAYGVAVIDPEQVYELDCDVFSPCALGGVLSEKIIKKMKAKIVAGAANNQLENIDCGRMLYQRGIFYAPDYVINAGGLIRCAEQYLGEREVNVLQKINNIPELLATIYRESMDHSLAHATVADRMAASKQQYQDAVPECFQ